MWRKNLGGFFASVVFPAITTTMTLPTTPTTSFGARALGLLTHSPSRLLARPLWPSGRQRFGTTHRRVAVGGRARVCTRAVDVDRGHTRDRLSPPPNSSIKNSPVHETLRTRTVLIRPTILNKSPV